MADAILPIASSPIGHTYWLTCECRDIGYGAGTGEGEFVYRGGPDDWGKHEFEPVDGGPVIYLFPDEIKDMYSTELDSGGPGMTDLPEVTVEAVTATLTEAGLPISERPSEMSWDRTPGVHAGEIMCGGSRRE